MEVFEDENSLEFSLGFRLEKLGRRKGMIRESGKVGRGGYLDEAS